MFLTGPSEANTTGATSTTSDSAQSGGSSSSLPSSSTATASTSSLSTTPSTSSVSSLITSVSPSGSSASSSLTSTTSPPSSSSTSQIGSVTACPTTPTLTYKGPPSISASGAGSVYASSCSSIQSEYYNQASSWVASFQTTFSDATSASVGTTVITEPVKETATLGGTTICDGFIRYNATSGAVISSSSALRTTTFTRSGTTGTGKQLISACQTASYVEFPYSYPKCSFPASDCGPFLQANATQTAGPPLTSFLGGVCSETSTTGSLPPWSFCTIAASTVQLYYWPATTTGDPQCDGTNGLTWTTVPPPTGTRTALVTLSPGAQGPIANGSRNVITVTSPSVYVAIEGVSATISNPANFKPVGSVTKGSTLLSYDPADLSSVVQHLRNFPGDWQQELSFFDSATLSSGARYATELPAGRGAWAWDFSQQAEPYNLFNLQRPVPASAYFFTPPGSMYMG